jgi:hypothetical protein
MQKRSFLHQANDRAKRVDSFFPLCNGSFSGMPQTSKSFKLPTFWLLDLTYGSRGLLKQKCIFFLGKRIMILLHVVNIKLVPLSMSCPIISRSYLFIFLTTFSLAAPLRTLRSMAEGPTRDPTAANPSADEDTGSDSVVESVTATASSPTHGAALMAKGEIPELPDFFKKTPVTDEERQAHHDHGWLPGNAISSIPKVFIPIVEGSTIVCFEPH